MAIPVLVLGESGSGKTASLRNFKGDELFICNVASKELPFKNVNGIKRLDGNDYNAIKQVLLKAKANPETKCKTFVIDDSQYLMAFEAFARVNDKGYDKYTDLAVHFKDLITFVITQLPKDFIVYFLHHVDRADDGHIKAKTLGKMLDNQLTVEGLFTNVILARVTQGEYKFIVHDKDGLTTVKTPLGMFEEDDITNDLKLVDTKIREFYEIQ